MADFNSNAQRMEDMIEGKQKKTAPKYVGIIIALVLLAVCSFGAYSYGNSSGHAAGYDEGYSIGREDGYDKGKEVGYSNGYSEGYYSASTASGDTASDFLKKKAQEQREHIKEEHGVDPSATTSSPSA